MFTNKNPEFFGYKIGQNIVPFINKCIEESGECTISEGTHTFGLSDNSGDVWKSNMIAWGWGRKSGVKLSGAGFDKTTLRLADNLQCIKYYQKSFSYVYMLQTHYNESCNNNVIEGITFDGNYDNNKDSESTINCLRIRGENNTVQNCRFINFGVGDRSIYECFQVSLLSIHPKTGGNKVLDNVFTRPGKKDKDAGGFVPENTFIAVCGDNVVVSGNQFLNCESNAANQRSPLHGITIGGPNPSDNLLISNNKFQKYQGSCFYIDSWSCSNVTIKDNEASDVWLFAYLSSQTWKNEQQISLSSNYLIENNKVKLANEKAYYQWNNESSYEPVFFGINNDERVDRTKYIGFNNISIKNNAIKSDKENIFKLFYGQSTDQVLFYKNFIFSSEFEMELADARAKLVSAQEAFGKLEQRLVW
jgi:hypothetical protein